MASIAIAICAAIAMFAGIGYPDRPFWDEIWYVPDARAELGVSGGLNNPEHPPLGKIIIGFFMAVFGDGPLGWRAASVVATAVLIAIIPRLYLATERDPSQVPLWVAVAPAIALALDPVIFTNARMATLDAMLGLFYVSAAMACAIALRHRESKDTGDRGDSRDSADSAGSAWSAELRRWAPASALAGVALATKWTALTLAPAFLLLAFLIVRDYRRMRIPPRTLLAVTLPGLVVYLGAFLAAGYSLARAAVLQWEMAGYHTFYFPPPTQYWRSHVLEWMIAREPIWLYFERESDIMRVIISAGSPIFWTVGLIAMVICGIVGFRKRDPVLTAVLLFPLVQLFLWAIAVRAVFIYYMSAILPFYAIAVAWGLARLTERGRKKLAGALAGGLVATSLVYFLSLYPVLVAEPLPPERAEHFFTGVWGRYLTHRNTPYERILKRIEDRHKNERARKAQQQQRDSAGTR